MRSCYVPQYHHPDLHKLLEALFAGHPRPAVVPQQDLFRASALPHRMD